VLEQAQVVCFDNSEQKLVFYDCEQSVVRSTTNPMMRQRAPVYHGGEDIESYTAWCEAGTATLMQFRNELKVQSYPYSNVESENCDFLGDAYEKIEGLFIPILGGGPSFSASSFAAMFQKAFEDNNQIALQSIIYPFRLTSLHYFASIGNKEAIAACYAAGAKFIVDKFGKTPLDYAIKSKDLSAVDAIYRGLNHLSESERNSILQKISINSMV
jgi:hypothetical protein